MFTTIVVASGLLSQRRTGQPRRVPMQVPSNVVKRDSLVQRVLRDEAGATAIEYGLIAALIAVAAIAAFRLVGTNLSSIFNTVATDL
jgi:pilus assembly protein Flp/PilA